MSVTNPICYPIALDLTGRRCLVVGGGALATEKAEGLLHACAEVAVVSPAVTPRLASLAAEHALTHHDRPYTSTDLEGIHLAYGASEDRALNAMVAHDARAAGVLVNAVDDIPNCDFFAVSIVRRGDLQIAISTNGLSPAFARWMREYIDGTLPVEYGDLLAVLGDVRRELKATGDVPPYDRWQAAITSEVMHDLRAGNRQGALDRVRQILIAQPDSSNHLEPSDTLTASVA
jgi:precorrin-2 dehydrogenase/sirohydrochlorin ferrochelatase